MKTFDEFLNEDFNSSKATQFVVPITSGGRTNKGTSGLTESIVFFEILPKRSFNLERYMKTFGTSTAFSTMKNKSGHWRGMFFGRGSELLSVIFDAGILHEVLAKSLDEFTKKSDKVPKYGYSKSYNATYLLDPGEKIDNWCFPLTYFERKSQI